MKGRFSPGIRVVYARCTDVAQEAAFNDWYERVHVPDILASGLTRRGARYRNSEPQEGEPDYLSIWELDTGDLEHVNDAFARMAARLGQEGRIHPAREVTRRGMWRRIGPEFTTPRSGRVRPGGLFIIESTCTEPDRLEEFNAWYDRAHILDLLATGLFITAYRFEAMTGQPGARYLALYETDGDPLEAVSSFSRDHRPRLKAAGRLSDIIDVTYRGIFSAMERA
jgi:hypothetical protein